MNSKRLTLEQATKYYLKGFSLAVKQIDYLDSSKHKEINDMIEMVSNRISEDYKNVFANSKKSTIYPTIDRVAEFIQDTMLYDESIENIKE
ncbi:hypothetical protein [Campylobacter sp.]|uniref:hypothetical protein n=1 Tax=Campylobacter sp. TaxID=205 RepID=UPI002A7EAF3A|nr:hypothetical protein [Campylobacter sp.]MDY4445561.1 hypothetical protein [Campylobacter sp.]MDY5467418.1 hypothetical protein [Campylobacter sp.]